MTNVGRFNDSTRPPTSRYLISGVTRNASGNALGGCTVEVFESVSNLFRGSTTSDGSGNYAVEISGDMGITFFANAYLSSSPNVAGTTINTLVASGNAGNAANAAQTTAFLARTSGLSGPETSAYTRMINGMVADGTWALLDALYVFATNNTTTANLDRKSGV